MTPRSAAVDRVVVVTGASSGIGLATAHLLAGTGARLVLSSRSETALREVEEGCRARGAADVLVVTADVADESAVEALRDAAVERFGQVDGWVHSAAVVAYGRFEAVPSEVFRRVVDVNVHGTVHSARVALRQFRSQVGGGTLVLVGSLLGEIATPFMSSYVSSKWAVRGLARVLAVEARETPGIRVCTVSPGGVDTPVYRQAATYLGRHGSPPPPVDPPSKVAEAIVACLDSPRDRVMVGLANPLARLGFMLMPPVFDRLVTPMMRRFGLDRSTVPPTEGNVFTPVPDLEAARGSADRLGRDTSR